MVVANTVGQNGPPHDGEHVPNTRRRYEPSRIARETSAEISRAKSQGQRTNGYRHLGWVHLTLHRREPECA